MTTMKATKDFIGPKGKIKEGQIVDITPRIAESWERQGIATVVGGKKKAIHDKALNPPNAPVVGSEGNDPPSQDDPGSTSDPKDTAPKTEGSSKTEE